MQQLSLAVAVGMDETKLLIFVVFMELRVLSVHRILPGIVFDRIVCALQDRG